MDREGSGQRGVVRKAQKKKHKILLDWLVDVGGTRCLVLLMLCTGARISNAMSISKLQFSRFYDLMQFFYIFSRCFSSFIQCYVRLIYTAKI